MNRTEATDTLGMGTIHETEMCSTYPGTETMTNGFNSRSGFLMSPSKQPPSSVSPNGFNGSHLDQESVAHGSIGIITPAPTSDTPESWPNVDERDFLKSPDVVSVQTRLSAKQTELPAPVAPPPSPEPREPDEDFDEYMVNKSTVTSLTPLPEEEEDLNNDENDGEGKVKDTKKNVTFEADVTNKRPTDDAQVGDSSHGKVLDSQQDEKTESKVDDSKKVHDDDAVTTVPDSDQTKDTITRQPGGDSTTFITQSDDVTETVNSNTQSNDATQPALTSSQTKRDDVTNSDDTNANPSHVTSADADDDTNLPNNSSTVANSVNTNVNNSPGDSDAIIQKEVEANDGANNYRFLTGEDT